MAEVARQSHSWYAQGNPDNPRNDPTYVERVAEVLLDHRGERVHLEPIVGGDPWVANEAVNCLRRLGWEILGEKGVAGYIFIGWKRPQRWTRLDGVYHEYIGAIVMRPKRHRRVSVLAGQMGLGL
jgi:hypothetical protein